MKDLYIIQCDKTGAFKVGITNNVKRRLKELQNGCPYTIKLVLLIKEGGHLEKRLHNRLQDYKTTKKNREWFKYECLAHLPDSIYEKLDLGIVDHWWIKVS